MGTDRITGQATVYRAKLARSKFRTVLAICGLVAGLILLFNPPPAYGQDTSITAKVNKTDVSTDELVILIVTIVDNSARQHRPLLPRLEGLVVVDLDLSTDVSLIDGQIYTAVTYTYRLQPRRTGTVTIPPVAVEIDGQLFQTSSLSVNVRQGAAPAPAAGNNIAAPDDVIPPAELTGQDFFVESVIDVPTPYVQQQIIHSFRFYQAIQLYKEPQYDEPLFTSFETLGLPVRQYNLNAAGRTYLITEIRTMLFAKTAGNVTIQPARLVLLGNIYEDPVEMYSEAVKLRVQPLPGNAPADFNGAVGQYSVAAWFSPQEAIVDRPATLHVAVTGSGNIGSLPEPTWPQLDDWRIYDTLSSLTTDVQDDRQMTGTRVFERLIVPGEIGGQIIPPAKFVFFDPITAEYRTISTEPLSVEVIAPPTPSPATATAIALVPVATPVPAGAPERSLASGPTLVNRAYVDSLRLSLSRVPPSVVVGLFFGLCGIVPLTALAGAGGLWLWRSRQQRPVTERFAPTAHDLKQSRQRIHPVLATAMNANADNYKAARQALTVYLEGTLGISLNGLTRSELADQLRRSGLDGPTIGTLLDCLAECDRGRYSPLSGDDGWSLMAKTDELLFALDRALKAA